MRLATSSDLYEWTRVREPLFEDGAWARDPFVIRIGEQWVMYYTATSKPTEHSNFVVAYRLSDDLLHWGPRKIAFTDPMKGMAAGPTESPFVVQRPEGFYLFLSVRGDYNNSEAFFSRSPFHFEVEPLSALPVHAGELVQDVDGAWYISHCGWDAFGLFLAPLQWLCDVAM
jgi:arabinan endo-1,5-alpha-L-arabinosidase